MTLLRKHDRLIPDQKDPWAIDKLQRREIGAFLNPIIASITQPFVITMESGYGTGKTCFLDCWAVELANTNTVVRFNAWETDFSHDPLAALLVCLRDALARVSDQGAADLIENGKKIMRAAASKLPAVLIKAALGKVLGGDQAKEFLEAVNMDAQQVSDLSVGIMEEALVAQREAEDARVQLRKVLEEMVARAKEQNNNKGNLIILVDDLDRCRPTYTIEILESIKHFFSVPGVIFILAIDAEALTRSVQATYGVAFGADNYLRKFIDWRYRLPPPDTERFADFLASRFEVAKLLGEGTLPAQMVVKSFGKASAILGLSLREQEQCFTELNLTLRSSKKPGDFASEIALLIVYRARHRAELVSLIFNDESDPARAAFFERMREFDCFGEEHRFKACMTGLFMDEEEADRALALLSPKSLVERDSVETGHLSEAMEYYRTAARYSARQHRAKSSLAATLFRRIEGVTGPRVA